MNNKDIVAKAIYAVVKEDLTYEQITNFLENPKTAEHGDVAFPAFGLAKAYRKAPQQIAQELAEKIQTSINTAIPLWKNQVAIALTLLKQKEPLLSVIKAARDNVTKSEEIFARLSEFESSQ